MPQGIVLHGTRSGQDYTIAQEYAATVNYVKAGANSLGWHCTIGEGRIALHLGVRDWGWNARAASPHYLAVEFAQPTAESLISDAQVETFVWWFVTQVAPVWPAVAWGFPSHAELEAWGETGQKDGKSDVYPNGSRRMTALRQRIWSALRGRVVLTTP